MGAAMAPIAFGRNTNVKKAPVHAAKHRNSMQLLNYFINIYVDNQLVTLHD